MTWLKKVIGGKSASEWLGEAAAYEEGGALGEAKLAYDRAFERAKGDDALRRQAEQGAERCCDGLARERIAHARELCEAGNEELAREELHSALETARSEAVQREVREAMLQLERSDAVEAARPAAAISAEERFSLIASSWEPLQAEELERYGDALMHALVALDEGQAELALSGLRDVFETAADPRYFWLELGRAQLVAAEWQDAETSLRTFLSKIGPEEGGSARLLAHGELARIAHDRGDTDAAIAELEACAAALEDDPRPYLHLGNYLRLSGRAAEAVEVLQMCAELFPEGQTEWPVLMELGLAHADAGQADKAIAVLEGVVEMLAARGHLDFPPVMAVPLAKLHEERGNLTRAADLFRALAEGSDVGNHGAYHAEAARVLEALGMNDEATRMRQRAEALGVVGARDDESPAADEVATEETST